MSELGEFVGGGGCSGAKTGRLGAHHVYIKRNFFTLI